MLVLCFYSFKREYVYVPVHRNLVLQITAVGRKRKYRNGMTISLGWSVAIIFRQRQSIR